MMLKKITLSSLALVTIALLSTGCLPKKETQEQVSKQEILPKQVQQNYTKPIPEIKKYDLAVLKYVSGESKPCYVITPEEIDDIYDKEQVQLH